MNHYEQKLERRRERLEARAEKLEKEANAKFNSGMERLRAIPFGQPILIGHHSEKRDRNYRRKAVASVDKGIELHKAAQEAAARAESVGTGGISSDDPDAVVKLKEKVAELERGQAQMVAGNKVIRAFWKAGNRAENTDEELARYFEKMKEAGFGAKLARECLKPDFCGRIGFPSYMIGNNNANIRRVKDRIAHLERNAERETVEKAVGNTGIRIVENAEANRLQIFFPGKPAAEVRAKLKSYGFRWAPSEGAWQRHLSNAAKWAAEQCTKEEMPG